MFKKLLPIFFLSAICIIFFWQVFLKSLVPIPSDTIVGLYHPYRDLYANDFPNGIPFKNFLITDPVRQQYPWRELSVNLSTWNPYSFAGAPNLANIQAAFFYPFNFLFFLFEFLQSWVILIVSQVFLATIFLYLYLRNLRLDIYSSVFGSVIFAFGGFSAMWLEWGTILHTALWLPLILLSIDKMLFSVNKNKKLFTWAFIFVFSMSSSLFAGHLQTFVYLAIFSFIYFFSRLYQSRNKKFLFSVGISYLIAFIITSIQTIPLVRFINLSARNLDQANWQKDGWFLPFEHLIQFIAPDFFGNPTTLNYWGTWNYGELTAYVGIAGLIFALFAMYFRRDKKTLFYGISLFVALVFALPTFVSKIPFQLDIPFLSTAQPTRLIFITTFSLSVLAALGMNYLQITKNKKNILIPIIAIFIIFGLIFSFTLIGQRYGADSVNLAVSKRNLILPFISIVLISFLVIGILINKKKIIPIFLMLIILFTIFDLFRFSWKFNTFASSQYLYPETTTIKFLKENIGEDKIASNDPRILAPNFSIVHKIKSVEGYDPIYLQRYGELVAAINRGEPVISPPFGFNRIVRIEDFDSPLIDMMGIKYILSLSEIEKENFDLVNQEGQTYTYENKNALPFVFFVDEVIKVDDKQEAINVLFSEDFNASKSAVVESDVVMQPEGKGEIELERISESEIKIKVNTNSRGFLVINETNYPTWEAGIYNSNGDMVEKLDIVQTNYVFKGLEVPEGEYIIVLRNKLL